MELRLDSHDIGLTWHLGTFAAVFSENRGSVCFHFHILCIIVFGKVLCWHSHDDAGCGRAQILFIALLERMATQRASQL